MTTESAAIARILVALDAEEEAGDLLTMAADLAVRTRAELLGLFVEDINLLRLAELPCSREVRYTGVVAAPDAGVILSAIRARADMVRRDLAAVAEPRKLRWSFRVVRGTVAGELKAAAAEADVMVIGRGRRAERPAPRLSRTTKELAGFAPGAVLIPGIVSQRGPLAVVYDASPRAERALNIASAIAGNSGLLVIDVGVGTSLDAFLEKTGLAAAQLTLLPARLEDVAATVNARGVRMVVFGCDPASAARAGEDILEAIHVPVLLVR